MSQDISNEPLHKYVSEYVWHALGESRPFGQKYWSHFSLCAYMYTHWPPRPPGPAETHWSPGPFGPPGYPDQPDLPNQTTLTHSSCLESSYRKSVQLALFVIDDSSHSATASHISVWTTTTRNDQCAIACGAIAEASRSLKAIKKCVNHQFSRQNCRNSNLLWQKCCI